MEGVFRPQDLPLDPPLVCMYGLVSVSESVSVVLYLMLKVSGKCGISPPIPVVL